ncbi:MAG: efflux RND transporter periplasmic adaptor subunit [bacterium]|nr:efflux RND transporter periplasmic adaptor subunit [bacterium]
MNYKALGVLLAALWCQNALAQEPPAKRLPNVEVLVLAPRPLTHYSTYMGHIEPMERASLSAELAGTVESADFVEGQSVKKGQILVQIETKRLGLNFRLARSNYELARDEFEREAQLFKNNLSNQAKLTQAKNRQEVAQVQMELAQLDLDKSQVSAPFDGVVSKKSVDRGEYLGKGAPMLEVLSLSKVKAKVNVPEREIGYVAPGRKVVVTLDALGDRVFEGQIQSLGLEADSKSRSFPVEVVVDNPQQALLAGMLARVKMVTMNLEKQVIIPRDAIMEDETGSYVFVLGGGMVVRRPVLSGIALGDEVQVKKGLAFGDRLVVVGQQLVTHQEPVKVLKSMNQAGQ